MMKVNYVKPIWDKIYLTFHLQVITDAYVKENRS